MTWMKAGEFECENGCKAVVLGRVPDPSDQPKFPWVGYVTVLKDQGEPRWMRISWTDDGKTAHCSCYNLKPPTQVRFMVVDNIGSPGKFWYYSLKEAVSAMRAARVVIAFEFRGGQLCDVSKIMVYIPDGPKCWRAMQLEDTFCKYLFTEKGAYSVESKVEEACDCGCPGSLAEAMAAEYKKRLDHEQLPH